LVKDRFELPEVTDKNMIHYRDTTFPDKKSDAFQACDYALRHWQRYLNENRCPNHLITNRDISKFRAELEPLEPVTIYNILGQLERFFNHENITEVLTRIRFIKEEDLRPKIKKVYHPLQYEQLIELYRVADEEDKVLIRFLLLQPIRIRDIPKCEFIKKGDTYRFSVVYNAKNEVRLDVDSETADVASIWIQKKNSNRKNPERLFNFKGYRSLDEHVNLLEEQLNNRLNKLGKAPLEYPLYAKNIQRYGRSLPKKDVLNWLSIASEKDTCPTCGRKLEVINSPQSS
jgi:hypothetical protein